MLKTFSKHVSPAVAVRNEQQEGIMRVLIGKMRYVEFSYYYTIGAIIIRVLSVTDFTLLPRWEMARAQRAA